MKQRKNLCAQIPLSLHTQVTEARETLGQTTSEYITNLLTEYFKMKENGGKATMATKGRTMAFQISEELFQQNKDHLERESVRLGRKVTQREFVLNAIIGALNMAEPMDVDEAGVAPCETPTGQAGPSFKGDVTGSDKSVAFPLPCDPALDWVAVFEAPIDLMGFCTLHSKVRSNILALCGLFKVALVMSSSQSSRRFRLSAKTAFAPLLLLSPHDLLRWARAGAPEATLFGTRERWRDLGRFVPDEDLDRSAKIFIKFPTGRGCVLSDAYDVIQTRGREVKPLEQFTKIMRKKEARAGNAGQGGGRRRGERAG